MALAVEVLREELTHAYPFSYSHHDSHGTQIDKYIENQLAIQTPSLVRRKMEKTLHYTIVDAFTSTPFGGNPAAVIVLPPSSTLPDSLTQQIASEFNLSETAFLVPKTTHSTVDGSSRTYGLRWFTPSVEVPLCGHATLASARVLFSDPSLTPESVTTLKFETLSGVLTAKKVEGGRKIELELPTIVGAAVTGDHAARVAEAVSEAVGGSVGIRGVQKEDAQAILLVQVDPAFDLEGAKVDATPFVRVSSFRTFLLLLRPSR